MEADPDFSAETTSENEHFDSEWHSSEENEKSGQTVVFTDNQDDSGLNDVDENAKLNNTIESTEKQKKLKQIKGINKHTINKQLRMRGGEYLGFTKPRAQKNTFHNKNRPDRKLGNRFDCYSKSKTLSCSALSETSRQTIFNQFWTELNWDQRKIYVAYSVKSISPKRPIISNETSRRTGTLQYEVNVNYKKRYVFAKRCIQLLYALENGQLGTGHLKVSMDQCDTCFKYKNNNLSEEEYNKHTEKKNLARDEKAANNEKAMKGEGHVITMDVQAVKLAPSN
ncbi:hypothetical protein JTB14_027107 [Gonioctena quinquepunctata]|nr:hypothetical protein JTB14_027107 [Gonioctena quinquepunctata]